MFIRWYPRAIFRISAIKDLWGFAVNFTGFNFINYWARNADNLVIGKMFGSAQLGFYNRAYFFMALPITQVIGVVSQVMIPALSSIQNDPKRIKVIYLKAIGVISFIAFPLMVGVLVAANPLILTLYGERWVGVIPLLRVLALIGMAQALSNPTGWIYTSQGRTDLLFRWGVGYAMILIVAIFIGAYGGSAQTVAICYATANVALLYPWLLLSGKIIDLSVKEIIEVVIRPFIASATMGVILWVLLSTMLSQWAHWQQLLALTATGMIFYGAIAWGFKFSALHEAFSIIQRQSPNQHLSETTEK
jgi:PST family polysaccharide transporter